MRKKWMMAGLILSALALTACGNKGTEEQKPDAAVETEKSPDAADAGEEGTAAEYKRVSYKDLSSKVVNLGEYKGLEGKRTVEEVTDEDVEDEIWQIKKESSELVDVDREAKEKDVVVIDYTGYVDGKTTEELQGNEYSLELGSGNFVPGFEEQLIGAVAEEDREVNLTFPEDYYEEIAGKEVRFDVHVHKVQEYDAVNWDEDTLKEKLGYDSEADMTASVREELITGAESEADANLDYDLINQVLDKSEFDIQDADVAAYTDEMLSEYETYASMYGVDLATYLQTYLNATEDQLREMYKETAVFRVELVLALKEIADKEGLTVSEEEYNARVEEMVKQLGYENASALEAVYTRDMVEEQMLQEKATSLIRESAVIS
ncbi:MAG TPA: trigger factor [Lachnospiraceae bacterium]|nr:trigger factor [Lachnospiraceae bacterium]